MADSDAVLVPRPEIQRELKMAPHRDDFRFESRWAVGIDELMRHLTELDPVVIHVSGHGEGSAGLVLQDEQGQPQPVSGRALAMVVGTTARNARVIVLNACYSTEQAEALRAGVDCVVGMDGAIGEDAARAFAMIPQPVYVAPPAAAAAPEGGHH